MTSTDRERMPTDLPPEVEEKLRTICGLPANGEGHHPGDPDCVCLQLRIAYRLAIAAEREAYRPLVEAARRLDTMPILANVLLTASGDAYEEYAITDILGQIEDVLEAAAAIRARGGEETYPLCSICRRRHGPEVQHACE
jgi:hypothetical protein